MIKNNLMSVIKAVREQDDKARMDVMKFIDQKIKLYGFSDVLKGFIFALDKSDEQQKKVLDALTRIAMF
jgi:hypothetical protein